MQSLMLFAVLLFAPTDVPEAQVAPELDPANVPPVVGAIEDPVEKEKAVASLKELIRLLGLEAQFNMENEALLREKGWIFTTDEVVTIWLWSKEINGKVYRVEKDTALHIQYSLDKDVLSNAAYDPEIETLKADVVHKRMDKLRSVIMLRQ